MTRAGRNNARAWVRVGGRVWIYQIYVITKRQLRLVPAISPAYAWRLHTRHETCAPMRRPCVWLLIDPFHSRTAPLKFHVTQDFFPQLPITPIMQAGFVRRPRVTSTRDTSAKFARCFPLHLFLLRTFDRMLWSLIFLTLVQRMQGHFYPTLTESIPMLYLCRQWRNI